MLTRSFPPALVDEVVAGADRTEQRSRLLPARMVVYCVSRGHARLDRRAVGSMV